MGRGKRLREEISTDEIDNPADEKVQRKNSGDGIIKSRSAETIDILPVSGEERREIRLMIHEILPEAFISSRGLIREYRRSEGCCGEEKDEGKKEHQIDIPFFDYKTTANNEVSLQCLYCLSQRQFVVNTTG